MGSPESEIVLSSMLSSVGLRVLKALAVKPFHVEITRLFLAPGSLGLGEWLLRRSDLKSGWRAGTEAAMTPIFCSNLKFAKGSKLGVWIFTNPKEVWKTYAPQMLRSTPLSEIQ